MIGMCARDGCAEYGPALFEDFFWCPDHRDRGHLLIALADHGWPDPTAGPRRPPYAAIRAYWIHVARSNTDRVIAELRELYPPLRKGTK